MKSGKTTIEIKYPMVTGARAIIIFFISLSISDVIKIYNATPMPICGFISRPNSDQVGGKKIAGYRSDSMLAAIMEPITVGESRKKIVVRGLLPKRYETKPIDNRLRTKANPRDKLNGRIAKGIRIRAVQGG